MSKLTFLHRHRPGKTIGRLLEEMQRGHGIPPRFQLIFYTNSEWQRYENGRNVHNLINGNINETYGRWVSVIKKFVPLDRMNTIQRDQKFYIFDARKIVVLTMDKAVELSKMKDSEDTKDLNVDSYRMVVIKYFNVFSQQIEGFKEDGLKCGALNKLALISEGVTPSRIVEYINISGVKFDEKSPSAERFQCFSEDNLGFLDMESPISFGRRRGGQLLHSIVIQLNLQHADFRTEGQRRLLSIYRSKHFTNTLSAFHQDARALQRYREQRCFFEIQHSCQQVSHSLILNVFFERNKMFFSISVGI